MSNTVIIKGRLVDDPEVRFTPSGAAVASFTIADNHRRKDGDQWVDDGATFWRCNAWRHLAEQAGEYRKGQAVLVVGKAKTRAFQTREGEERKVLEVTVDEIGGSPVKEGMAERKPVSSSWQGRAGGLPKNNWAPTVGGDDPWATPKVDGPNF